MRKRHVYGYVSKARPVRAALPGGGHHRSVSWVPWDRPKGETQFAALSPDPWEREAAKAMLKLRLKRGWVKQ